MTVFNLEVDGLVVPARQRVSTKTISQYLSTSRVQRVNAVVAKAPEHNRFLTEMCSAASWLSRKSTIPLAVWEGLCQVQFDWYALKWLSKTGFPSHFCIELPEIPLASMNAEKKSRNDHNLPEFGNSPYSPLEVMLEGRWVAFRLVFLLVLVFSGVDADQKFPHLGTVFAT